MKKLILATLALSVANVAQAHEVWIERGADGKAQIWLGEPDRPMPAEGDPAFSSLKAPKLVPASNAAQTRGAGYIEVDVPAGDVRAWDDDVFKPWTEDGKTAGVTYYARSGRTETTALMPFEIVPVAAGGTRFTVTRDDKPVTELEVTIVSPQRWMLVQTTDDEGQFDVPLREAGRYILKAEQKDRGNFSTTAGDVEILHLVTTTSFKHE